MDTKSPIFWLSCEARQHEKVIVEEKMKQLLVYFDSILRGHYRWNNFNHDKALDPIYSKLHWLQKSPIFWMRCEDRQHGKAIVGKELISLWLDLIFRDDIEALLLIYTQSWWNARSYLFKPALDAKFPRFLIELWR